jgi:hypothetical protein
MLQAGVIISDYATLMVESSKTMRDRRPVDAPPCAPATQKAYLLYA